jgi:hypothetical protein
VANSPLSLPREERRSKARTALDGRTAVAQAVYEGRPGLGASVLRLTVYSEALAGSFRKCDGSIAAPLQGSLSSVVTSNATYPSIVMADSLQESGRVNGQDHRLARRLGEVEVLRQIAKLWGGFAHIGPRVWPAIGLRIQSLAAEEVVFDELKVGVEAQCLVVETSQRRLASPLASTMPNASRQGNMSSELASISGALGGIRTPDPRFRSLTWAVPTGPVMCSSV